MIKSQIVIIELGSVAITKVRKFRKNLLSVQDKTFIEKIPQFIKYLLRE